jgi:hypothetical protein
MGFDLKLFLWICKQKPVTKEIQVLFVDLLFQENTIAIIQGVRFVAKPRLAISTLPH